MGTGVGYAAMDSDGSEGQVNKRHDQIPRRDTPGVQSKKKLCFSQSDMIPCLYRDPSVNGVVYLLLVLI